MKTLIVALNSKFIHSALAPWYLKAACGDDCGEVCVIEHTINENTDAVLSSIYLQKPDIAAFSCYIWNITMVMKLASSLKKLLPETVIVLGGPEVSYNAGEILKKNSHVDFILAGEGEASFPKLLNYICTSQPEPELIEGLAYRAGIHRAEVQGNEVQRAEVHGNEIHRTEVQGNEVQGNEVQGNEVQGNEVQGNEVQGNEVHRAGNGVHGIEDSGMENDDIIVNPPAFVEILDSIPSPYTDVMMSLLNNKIVYFETSRGCPFSCSYCLSSATEGTRFFSLERVFSDLDRLAEAGVKQIKFVDRTFNSHKRRAIEIIRHIIELNKQINLNLGASSSFDFDRICPASGNNQNRCDNIVCNFHFEVGADLFDEETIQLLESAPKGLFQIEAGVQSTNNEALEAVNRKTNLDKLFRNLIRLKKSGNIHIHADLIAGLPHEGYDSFAKSFDMLYFTQPHQLQLGFLKFLKGTKMRNNASEFGYIFNHFPPYEILSGEHITYDELVILKGIAELADRYYNSNRFVYSLEYIIEEFFKSPFIFYENFYNFNKKNGHMQTRLGVRELYAILHRFASFCMNDECKAAFRELLRLDFLASDNSGTLPDFLERRSYPGFNEECLNYLREPEHIKPLMREAAGMSAKQLIRKVHFELFHLEAIQLCNGDGDERALRYNRDSNTVIMFNYLMRDKVTGRYPFYLIEIK